MGACHYPQWFWSPRKENLSLFPLFLFLFATKLWDWMPWSWFFKCWVLSQIFHCPLSPSSRGSLVPLHFLHESDIICISEVVEISPGSLNSSLWFIQPASCMMYSANKLNKQGDNIQPWRTPFPILNQSFVLCLVLTVASWPAYRSSQKAGKVVWYSYIFKNFPQFVVIHTVKGFEIVNKAEVDDFLKLLLFLWSNGCWQFDFWFLCLS